MFFLIRKESRPHSLHFLILSFGLTGPGRGAFRAQSMFDLRCLTRFRIPLYKDLAWLLQKEK